MKNGRIKIKISRWKVIVFWALVISILVGIYFFQPGLINRMRQTTYQETPFVNTPHQ